MASIASALSAIYTSYGDSMEQINEDDRFDKQAKELLSMQSFNQMLDMVVSTISNTMKSESDTFSNLSRNI